LTQCVAVCSGVLQCVTVRCREDSVCGQSFIGLFCHSVLQCVAVCRGMLRCVTVFNRVFLEESVCIQFVIGLF